MKADGSDMWPVNKRLMLNQSPRLLYELEKAYLCAAFPESSDIHAMQYLG